ncbi:MAG: efflux RND transporter permease subunit [Candidatus Hydrogenedentes bacterium]|nr:efflux RND transporter permease subunit [Candidatus Hydrogenedentota bacterium]
MSDAFDTSEPNPKTFTDKVILFCLRHKLVVWLLMAFFAGWGVVVAPFDWDIPWLPRNPVAVDAIPDIGENQQIVFTEWEGRSPQDVEDQITYPLTTALLGIPGVRTIRSYSYFGFSTIFIIFEEKVEFYWSRSRVLEKLNSLPSGSLPEGVQPALGPDATALGQVFWYTLEGRDPEGNPAGGWDLHELRSIQDWQVRYALLGAGGVSEVASVGGYVQEYQIDVDPDAMRAHRVTLDDVFNAVRKSNVDVGARTIEVNKVEYVIRGLGFLSEIRDIEDTVVRVNDNVPIYIKNIAKVALGPEMRRGMLNKEGAEAVGGVVVVRYGSNPLEAIKNVKGKIGEIAPGLPARAVVDYRQTTPDAVARFAADHGLGETSGPNLDQDAWLSWLRTTPKDQWPAWVTLSQVTVVPFYDRTGLIYETLGTLNEAIVQQIIITVIVIIVIVAHVRSSILISMALPLSVLTCFIAMKLFGVDANIVALSGIAIAIGTLVDMGIIICENILRHLDSADSKENRLHVVYRAASEVGRAVVTAVSTTIISFLPVFTMIGSEGKLFKPLAFTKTFALIASVVVALTIIPALAHILLAGQFPSKRIKRVLMAALVGAGVVLMFVYTWWAGLILAALGLYHLAEDQVPARVRRLGPWIANAIAVMLMVVLLTNDWLPLGPSRGMTLNLIFVVALVGGVLGFFTVFQYAYPPLLRLCLRFKFVYMLMPVAIVALGAFAWLGFGKIFGFLPNAAERIGISADTVRQSALWSWAFHTFPGFGKEFMPPLDEGSYLYMPTTMSHASIGEAMDIIDKQDRAISSIPEVELVVGKLGRAESPLDPAPINMIETIVNYKPEYLIDESGHRLTFAYDEEKREYLRDARGALVPDPQGKAFRLWREHIQSASDIWDEIVVAAEVPGTTSAPRLQPIAARIVMLQSGMRAPMGVKVKGPDLETIEKVGLEIERYLKEVPGVEPAAVIADRVVGNPYIEIAIDRQAIARYGLSIREVQDVIEVAIGGMRITTTVEGRERYPVRVRYQRELRDQIETLGRILVPAMDGAQIPLEQLAHIRYERGPMAIKSEDTFLVGYVLFDKQPQFAEVDVVETAARYLTGKLASGEWSLPAGVSYSFAGNYENQLRAQKTLALVLPVSLFAIFLILYFQFSSLITTGMVFSSILVAWSGGFIFLWLYGQPWFMDFAFLGVNMRELFQVHAINLSVAIWVGFLALFGVASDDNVVIATYLDQSFAEEKPRSISDIREATLIAGKRRIRPCLTTTATTILALVPVLTSTGRGADIMLPMALPSFGGMAIEMITLFMTPVMYCWVQEIRFSLNPPEGCEPPRGFWGLLGRILHSRSRMARGGSHL